MSNNHLKTINPEKVIPIICYEKLLAQYGISYEKSGIYLLLGNIPIMQGWVFYIPVGLSDIIELLNKLVPFVANGSLGMKIPINSVYHQNIKEGNMGNEYWGKVICIYSATQNDLSTLATELINLTGFAKDAIMPGAYLGGIVYTRFGGFEEIVTPEGCFIVNRHGELERDDYSIPYIIPNWVSWPFETFEPILDHSNDTLLNNKYFTVKPIRDAKKGRILLAIQKKNIFQFKKVLIKEGRPGMLGDEYDRDIVNRLDWQGYLHKQLADKLNIPSFVDFFKQNRNTYLVIQFIDGLGFEAYLDSIFKFRVWFELREDERFKLVESLIDIIDVIEKLHHFGFVHRDISIGNFMVDKKGKIVLIDLELAYNINDAFPNPPFQVGTPGYISPEQKEQEVTPEFSSDIYSIGALIIMTLTYLSPRKFDVYNSKVLWENLNFFIRNKELANIITECLQIDSDLRPQIKQIKECLLEYLKNGTIDLVNSSKVSKNELNSVIVKSMSTFSSNLMLNEDGIWLSQINNDTDLRNVLIGVNKGIGGVIILLARLKSSGFDVAGLLPAFKDNWEFTKSHFLFAGTDVPEGLYNGSYGLAISISAAIDAGLLPLSEENVSYIRNCLNNVPETVQLNDGISGFGLALIYCLKYLEPSFFNDRISIAINRVLNSQDSKGSWLLETEETQSKVYFLNHFDYGNSGMICFLIECFKLFPNEEIKESIKMGLKWIGKKHERKDQTPLSILVEKVSAGYTYLKAFEVFKDNLYRDKCEEIIFSIPEKFVDSNFSVNKGLAGLGIFYIECFGVLRNVKIIDRIKWIVDVFIHTAKLDDDENIYWVQGHSTLPSGDLLEGNGGIVYFLLRCLELYE